MSLSVELIDWLFGRLQLAYGRDFLSQYDGLEPQAVRASWAYELAAFDRCQHVLDWALEHLPDKPPSVLVFRSLCRAAPPAKVPRLPAPAANPDRVKVELERLAPLRVRNEAPPGRQLDWARRVLARHEAGECLSFYTVRTAKQALGVSGVAA